MSTIIAPYNIEVADSQLQDLQTRLKLIRWPEKECVNGWSQGVPLSALQSLCDYWLNEYDWRRCERQLNQYPQFVTDIDGLDIHFFHIRSSHANAKPLIITHGWPGSIMEFMKIVGPLTQPEKYGGDPAEAFHLVLPSLPGFGFSGKPSATGWSVEKIAKAWVTLMKRLGYQEFLAQGGDWGGIVTSAIGRLHPPECKAIHLNMVVVEPDPETLDQLTEAEQSALAGMQHYADWDSGYSKQQSTRPQTIGYGLVDSPVALAAWIYEKFYFWTDNQGTPETVLQRDEILDNIMIYWLNSAGASSARLYWESFNNLQAGEILLPTGVTIFPKEIFRASRRWAEKSYKDIVYWSEVDKGGHFAAFEQPELFVNEIRGCFKHIQISRNS